MEETNGVPQESEVATEEVAEQEAPTPQELVQKQIDALPFLVGVQEELDLCALYFQRFVAPNRTPKQTQKVLETLMNKTFDDVVTAAEAVAEVVSDVLIELDQKIEEATGREVDEQAPMVPQVKYILSDEREEQDAVRDQGRELLNDITLTAQSLGIEYQETDDPEVEKQPGRLKTMLQETFTVEIVDDEPVEEVEQPSWRTDPVIDMESEDVEILTTVREVIDMNQGQRQASLDELEDFGYPDDVLADLFRRLEAQVRQQFNNHGVIMSAVGEDAAQWIDELEEQDEVLDVIRSVHKHASNCIMTLSA